MKTTYIYALLDPRTNEIKYVGKSDYPKARYKTHCKRTDNKHLMNWIKQLKRENLQPSLMTLEECDNSIWQERERYWIKYYREQGCKLTNLTDGGDGTIGYEFTEEVCKKISAFHKGKPLSFEHRRKIGEAQTGEKNHRYGKKADNILLAKLSKAHSGENNGFYGRHHTQESIEKERESLLKYYREHPEKIRRGKNHPMFGKKGKDNPNYGKPAPEHVKKAVAKANHERVWSEESRRKQSESQRNRQKREREKKAT